METFELRYFLAVAETQNIHNAAKLLNISPSAVSKALSRLEEELEVKLFEKVGRNIKITNTGSKLVSDALEMLAIEKRIVESHSPTKASISMRIIGPELLLARWSPTIIQKILNQYKDAVFSVEVAENEQALAAIKDFSADLAIISSASSLKGKMYKELADVEFKTFVSIKHPLANNKSIHVKDLLKEKFVVTEPSYLGISESSSSPDGWRDDKFKRERVISTKSLKCLESLLLEGMVVSYLPEYYGLSLGLKQLEILGCPYSCRQKIYLMRGKYSLDSAWSLI